MPQFSEACCVGSVGPQHLSTFYAAGRRMNCLRTLLKRLADAASYWLQTPFDAADELWLNQPPRDGADRLAEREAEEEVSEPAVCESCGGVRILWHTLDCERALREAHSTSAAPDIRSSVDAADGPRGTAAQPETRAGHPPCSAVKPDTTWAICTKPRGHESTHGYGGIFWDDESPQ
jgi:hypothetical protein